MARDVRTRKDPGAAPGAARAALLRAGSDRRGEAGGRGERGPPPPPAAPAAPPARKARADDDRVNVFISYAHADHVVAAALRDALTEVDRNRVDCFLDSASIRSGERWKKKLDDALARADWLVCVFTGEQSQWCGYEVGVFTQSRAQSRPRRDSRLVCLHDTEEAPGLFAAGQNKPVLFLPHGVPAAPAAAGPGAWSDEEVEFYRGSSVFRFLADFCDYKRLYPVRDAADGDRQTRMLLEAAKRITLAFDAARGSDIVTDTPTQLKLEVSFGSNASGVFHAIPDDARVTGTFASFGLFRLMPPTANRQLPSITWGDLKAASLERSPANALWMDTLEGEMLNAARGVALGPPEAVFASASNGKLYRPILVRHVVRHSGAHQFDLIFIETLPRQFVGVATTSLLLAGLVQASRFRFAFLEQPDRVAAKFDDSRTDKEFEVNCRQLRYDIARIEAEAAELGVLDLRAFVAAFGPERRAQAEDFIKDWRKAKEALLPQLPDPATALTPQARGKARDAITAFFAAMEKENRSFVLAALDAYRGEVAR